MISLEEKILTPQGFRRYGDISVGDEVYSDSGEVQVVTGESEVNYSPEAYRVWFCNGTYIDACAEHLWTTHTKNDRRSLRRFSTGRKPTVKTTREIKETLMAGKEYNHSIPYTKPVVFPKVDTLIDPYLLGCWLGDGSTAKAGMTSMDEQILDAFREKYTVKHISKYDYSISGGFLVALREEGVLGNKHVPHKYLFNSIENRLALLQGLMDTDGTINKEGNQCSFDNTNKDIIDAVYFLVASLGMKPILHERVGKLYGVEKKKSWRIHFSALMPVFRLSRKLEKCKPFTKSPHHTVVKVEPVESVPMKCIAVSGESKLYLIGESLIPTHNTSLEIYVLYRWAMTNPGGQYYYIAPYYNQAAEIVWKPGFLQNFLYKPDKGIDLRNKYIKEVHETDRRIVFHNGSFIKLLGADNYESGRGLTPDGAVYDEFKDHDYRFHEGFKDNLLPKKAPLLVVGTPPATTDHFFVRLEEDYKLDPRGSYHKMPTHTNPHIDREELELERVAAIAKGEYAKYMREIMAEIVPGGADAIFPMFTMPELDVRGDFKGESTHVKRAETLDLRIERNWRDYSFYCAFDPGSSLVFGVSFMAVNKYTKQVIILDEIYETNRNLTSPKIIYPKAEAIMKRYAPVDKWHKVYDYAATWFQVEVQREFGVSLLPCTKDVNKKEVALSNIKDFLLEPCGDERLIVVADRCKKTIWEVTNYSTDEHGNIPKKDDHLIDAIRYNFNAAGLSTIPRDRRQKPEDVREWSREDYMDDEEYEVLDFDPYLEEEIYGDSY